jgi:hypothetical protein
MAVIFVLHVWWPSKRWMFLLTRHDAEAAAERLMEEYARDHGRTQEELSHSIRIEEVETGREWGDSLWVFKRP